MLSINSEFVLSPSVLNITGWSLRYHWVPCVLLSWSLIISIWLTVGNWVQLQSQLEPALGGQGRSATTQSSHQWPIRTEPERAQPIRGRADWSLPCSAWAPVQSRPQHTAQTSSKHWTIFLTWLYLMKLQTLNRFYYFLFHLSCELLRNASSSLMKSDSPWGLCQCFGPGWVRIYVTARAGVRAALPLLEERKAAPRMQSHLAQIFHTKIVGGRKAANIFVDNIRGR